MNNSFPLNIYISRKKTRNRIYLYVVILLASIIAFWIASGKFFTEDHFYPTATILLPIFIIIMIVGIFAEIKSLNRKIPVITLNEEGISYYGHNTKPVPFVRWDEIAGVEERMINNEKNMVILVKDIHSFINKIENEKGRKWFKNRVDKTNDHAALFIELRLLNYDLNQFDLIFKQSVAEAKGKNQTLYTIPN